MPTQTAVAYKKWCEHYGYQPGTLESQQDYARYFQNLDFFEREIVKAETRGRKPKLKSGAMSAAERKTAERARRTAAGEKLMWVTIQEQVVIAQMRANGDPENDKD